MGCSTPDSSHYAGCACNEAHWQDQVARLTRERDEARERAAEIPGLRLRLAQAEGSASAAEAAWKTENGMRLAAEARASSLSRELLDAMQARNRLAERAVTMQLMLDTIEGWATGQPGKMPTAVEDGWSTALSAAVARVTAAESRAARLLTALKHLLKAFLMLHRACGTGSAEQWPEVEDARAAIAAEEGK